MTTTSRDHHARPRSRPGRPGGGARSRRAGGAAALGLALAILTGCAPVWERPHTTRDQANHDSYECRHEAYVAPPRERESLYKLCMRARGYRETDPDADRPRPRPEPPARYR
jgi:hypothetical protein